MHIEPGIISPDKLLLSYATGALALSYGAHLVMKEERGRSPVHSAARFALTSMGTFIFFEVFPHFPVGVSELHLIFGTALVLLFGAGAAAFGLALGLLVQGMFFAPTDLPQYFANLTTLLVPLYGVRALAQRGLRAGRAYSEFSYADIAKLSLGYQAGVVAWVAFWVCYGQGFSLASAESLLAFGVSYVPVVALEPLVGLALLALAKGVGQETARKFFSPHLVSGTPAEG